METEAESQPSKNLTAFLESLRETGSTALEMPFYPMGKGADFLKQIERSALEDGSLLAMLHDWHRVDSLEAGRPLFDEEAAWWGARMFIRSAWLYLERGTSALHLESLLGEPMPHSDSAAAHFSADLCLRWLPDLYAQARAISPTDPLLTHLRTLASRAPLSGIGIPWKSDDSEAKGPATIPNAAQNDTGIWRLLIDRVIERRDREKLSHPAILNSVRSALGAYADILAKGLLDGAAA